MHWAANYVGRPWSPTNNCWALVREVLRDRWDVAMPDVSVGEPHDHVAEIKRAATASGWRPADGAPIEGDIALCRDAYRKRHVGVIVGSPPRLLHSHRIAGVLAQPLPDAIAAGITDLELWRRA